MPAREPQEAAGEEQVVTEMESAETVESERNGYEDAGTEQPERGG